LAKKWEKQIGEHLVKEVHKQARKNFNEFIEQGGRLSYLELRKLNSTWKKDYIGHITENDTEATLQLKKVISHAQEANHNITELLWEMEDIKEDWA